MSIENTLAERGNRYGDFTDHADLAQGIQFRMQKFCLKADNADGFIEPWKDRLNNVQRQALTVIADKIARILSGDPNYADNWHDIQGYAKLVEDRLPTDTAVQPTLCKRCLLPHADEMPPGAAETVANQAVTTHLDEPTATAAEVAAEFLSRAAPILSPEEPAAHIDDESDRQKAVEQNGNDGAVYDDPWYGAPEWAKYKAQDSDGTWWWYDEKPEQQETCWGNVGAEAKPVAGQVFPNPSWRDTLISR